MLVNDWSYFGMEFIRKSHLELFKLSSKRLAKDFYLGEGINSSDELCKDGPYIERERIGFAWMEIQWDEVEPVAKLAYTINWYICIHQK